MKKVMLALSTFILVIGLSSTPTKSVDAAVKTFKNCTELNKTYKGGVAKSKTTKNKGGKTHYTPYVSKALYDANKARDRDKDGIACER
ncbi:excalibur calcium-binding domain-containing protein [Exiguobacterium profundum]|uniref:excalibur calcium-binding domain-containing protein n=1 Tax=Exiguobacterium TaxID=33986 RepID=UPI0018C3687F|nr:MULTISPECIES: excalibur calcium-binding domain-containing protein [Exiguobacterium]MBG0917024.1 excalibur calcium-binding domain-containing protein [Exiguobacterium sp. SRB7LM]MCT4798193.1 excalibur calcium-binding domain-containing protein [Exiguobacterium profundum]MDT0191573.1 excalibur calcium-binding domain-containing protein [Exiguobacterium sp. BG5(2022)]QPI69084.1 excalibur calcium-binding domain-containing protein [Exiguobacterium sp. PBE]